MATSVDYLKQLQTDKANLVANLIEKGVDASDTETFTSLVPKVLDIQSGSGEDSQANAMVVFSEYNVDGYPTKALVQKAWHYFQTTYYLPSYLLAKQSSMVSSYGANFTSKLVEVIVKPTNCDEDGYGITEYTFGLLDRLTKVHIYKKITSIKQRAFNSCTKLTLLIFYDITKVPTLENTYAFNNTPIASGTGYIYVPDNLVEDFKVADKWSTYANQIKGLSELPTEE